MGRSRRGTNLIISDGCIEALAWALSFRADPTVEQIIEKFGVSRATGFRWRAVFRDARERWLVHVKPATANTFVQAPTESRLQ